MGKKQTAGVWIWKELIKEGKRWDKSRNNGGESERQRRWSERCDVITWPAAALRYTIGELGPQRKERLWATACIVQNYHLYACYMLVPLQIHKLLVQSTCWSHILALGSFIYKTTSLLHPAVFHDAVLSGEHQRFRGTHRLHLQGGSIKLHLTTTYLTITVLLFLACNMSRPLLCQHQAVLCWFYWAFHIKYTHTKQGLDVRGCDRQNHHEHRTPPPM